MGMMTLVAAVLLVVALALLDRQRKAERNR